jgi:uncharacterized membrane protein YjdF
MRKRTVENAIRNVLLLFCEAFTLFTVFLLLFQHGYKNLPICLATFGLVLIPAVIERCFRCRIHLAVYVFGVLYAMGPMLGDCYQLYYSTSWWDKMLHTFGGIAFAILGIYLFERISGGNQKVLACAVFALCFSVTIAAFWELIEFGSDQLFGTDMQRDTVISAIHSYNLGDDLGVVGRVEEIAETQVNGTLLPIDGYLDVGLIDSMVDLIFESLGAVIVSILFLLDRGKHPLFVPKTAKAANQKQAQVE